LFKLKLYCLCKDEDPVT